MEVVASDGNRADMEEERSMSRSGRAIGSCTIPGKPVVVYLSCLTSMRAKDPVVHSVWLKVG